MNSNSTPTDALIKAANPVMTKDQTDCRTTQGLPPKVPFLGIDQADI